MSIKTITEDNQIDLKCGTMNCKLMDCNEMISENLFTRNDDMSITKWNTPTNGNNDDVLKSNGDGTVYWGMGSGEIYSQLSHTNVSINAGTGGSSNGFSVFNDRKYICSKNGNLRTMSGEIDIKIDLVNGFSSFTIEFDTPYNELTITRAYGTAIGYISVGQPMMNSVSVSGGSSPQNRLSLYLRTVDDSQWTQNTINIVRIMYKISYLV